jgi:hypothetical protein
MAISTARIEHLARRAANKPPGSRKWANRNGKRCQDAGRRRGSHSCIPGSRARVWRTRLRLRPVRRHYSPERRQDSRTRGR